MVKLLVKGKASQYNQIPQFKNSDQSVSLIDLEKANTYNNFFTSIANVDNSSTELPDRVFCTNNRLDNFVISEQEITDALSNLLPNKAKLATECKNQQQQLLVYHCDYCLTSHRSNTDLNELNLWSKQWLINLNPAKTEFIFLSLARRNKPNLIFNDTPPSFVDHHKHLGVSFSSHGSWQKHIPNIVSTASKILGSMKLLKFQLKRHSLNQIYISYLQPHLEYASLLWDSCTQNKKIRLKKSNMWPRESLPV